MPARKSARARKPGKDIIATPRTGRVATAARMGARGRTFGGTRADYTGKPMPSDALRRALEGHRTEPFTKTPKAAKNTCRCADRS